MKTKKIGELLRERRESHRLSIDRVAQLTHIKSEYIRLIEENRFEALPPAVYVKGYIRSLGEIFGVEVEPLLALLRRDYKEAETGVLYQQNTGLRRRTALWHGSTKWSALLVIAVLGTIFAYVIVQWLFSQRPPQLVVDSFAQLTEITPDATLVGHTSPEAIVLINDVPVALRPDGSFSYQLQLEQTGLVTIKIEARDQRGKSTTLERVVRIVPNSN